ncbi:outer membrane protein assembly factor BamB family protein [Gilvimarinus sp. F26214L]|uniref:outer membrane protein assembly factor BamB family protein n=1 Tax=Gilvimarinus sp. DZF01 TaxID=3461371 RepID=UPI00404569A5
MRHLALSTAAFVATACLTVSCSQLNSTGSSAPSWNSLQPKAGEWITWGGDLGNKRYSPLDQINKENAQDLQVNWRWQAEPLPGRHDSNWKATPLYVDGVLYLPTGGSKVAALDPATGETLWLFTPDPLRVGSRPFTGSSRAVSFWTDGERKRILHNSIDGRLFSIDAQTGEPDRNFGTDGFVDLNENLLAEGDGRSQDDVGSTAPGIVVGDVIVVQVIGNDTPKNTVGTPGYIRGFDVRTGELLWTFHTIPRPGEFGHETWEDGSWSYTGAASVWTMMSADPELGYVYLPVESPTNNFWGGQRPGDGLFGESIVCLDAKTGERVWHFQILHHGVWDYDLPAAPILHDIEKDGKTIKAVTVLTKQGMNFVFDRVTGEPVWPIEERPVPTEMAVPGEKLSPTQPFPTKPAPYSNLGYHEEDLIDFTPELRAQALEIMKDYVTGPMYTPPTLVGEGIPTKGTLVYPNYGGGSNWNGGAFDVDSNTLFVPTRNTYMTIGLKKADPNLTDWKYLPVGSGARPLSLPNGLPVNRPPWALVTATDMNRGEHIWSRSIGGAPDRIRNHPDLQGLDLDFDNMGQISVRPSPLVTRSLMFLAESANIGGDPGDRMFRAYDKQTGEVVAEIELPALTSGAPMTYMHEGRQYIAVALSSREHPAELITLSLPRPGDETAAPVPAAQPRSTATVDLAETVDASPQQLKTGRQMFGQHCAVCHGSAGEGLPQSGAPALRGLGHFADIKAIIGNGSAEMPAMAAVMTADQLDAVARYVAVELSGRED